MKECTDCKRILPYECFNKEKKAKDGYRNQCKDCTKIRKSKYNCVCLYCGKQYKTRDKKSKFCSHECLGKYSENKIKTKCDECGKEIILTPSIYNRNKNHYCSARCQRIGYSKRYSGENSPRFNPDLDKESRITYRRGLPINLWRTEVFKRDNYTCKCCGTTKSGVFNAHHIYDYKNFEEYRTDIDNGITLCTKCHKLFHKEYGMKGNNYNQIIEFLKIHANPEIKHIVIDVAHRKA